MPSARTPRGFIVSVGGWRNLAKFIKECMAGKIPF